MLDFITLRVWHDRAVDTLVLNLLLDALALGMLTPTKLFKGRPEKRQDGPDISSRVGSVTDSGGERVKLDNNLGVNVDGE